MLEVDSIRVGKSRMGKKALVAFWPRIMNAISLVKFREPLFFRGHRQYHVRRVPAWIIPLTFGQPFC